MKEETINMKEETITLDEYYVFERPVGYVAFKHTKVEDEIMELCKKEQIYVGEIIRYDGYKVLGKKIKSKKLFDKFNT